MEVREIKYKNLDDFFKKLENYNCIAVKKGYISSKKELELALYLAKKSFNNDKNIAREFKYEFLLWLTGNTNIDSAMKETKPRKNENTCLLISLDGKFPNNQKSMWNLRKRVAH